jgi:uncharacterized phage protein (TIGR02218 family)
MKSLTAAMTAHLQQEVTTLAVCWRVTRGDGVHIRGTEHDQDITIVGGAMAGTYLAGAGITGSSVASNNELSVDNVDVQGAISPGDLAIIDLSAADIEAGLLDGASVVMFLLNWAAPSDGLMYLRRGTLGVITRTSEGSYRAELRGVTQKLSQNMLRTYSTMCDAQLGDSRCTVNIVPLRLDGTVTLVYDNRIFEANLSAATTDTYFDYGYVDWLTGGNAGYQMEVKAQGGNAPTYIELFLGMAKTVSAGDTFRIYPGCNKGSGACLNKFNNLVNFRGHGAWVPAQTTVQVFGGQAPRKKKKKNIWLG